MPQQFTVERQEVFGEWQNTPKDTVKYNDYVNLCIRQSVLLKGKERTPELAEQLGLTDPLGRELFVKYGVIVEGASKQGEMELVKALVKTRPEAFTKELQFLVWTDPRFNSEGPYWDGMLILPRSNSGNFAAQIAPALRVIWERDRGVDTYLFGRYANPRDRDKFVEFNQERFQVIFGNPDSEGEMIKASELAGGHWMVCLNNEWLSIFGSFSREELESALEKTDLPADEAAGWHLVNVLRSQTFQEWETEPGNADKYNQYLDLCRRQTEMMRGGERTREMAEQLGLKDDYAQELYIRYGVIIEGQRGQEELKLVENMWASMPEVFVLDTRFIAWTDAPMEQGYRLAQKTVIFRHADAQQFSSHLEDMLEVIWERELQKNTRELCNSFNWSYGDAKGRDAYQRIYQERIRTIFANSDSSAGLFKVSDFAGGHWIIRVRDNWVSVIGDFSRAQLKDMYENFMDCPANHIDGFRIVQENWMADAAGVMLNNIMGLESNRDIEGESKLSVFQDMQSRMEKRSNTPHVATHETGHFIQYRLGVEGSPEAKKILLKWHELHVASDDRRDFVTQYAYDATGPSWVGDPERESWAETYEAFREELATGCFWLSGTRPLIQEKLLVMAHLFVVREEGGDFLYVDGCKTPIALEPDGSISLEALDLWSQERVKERIKNGEDSLEKMNWEYVEKIAPELNLVWDQDQAIYTLADVELLIKQAENYPETFFWMTGIRAEDTEAMAKLRETNAILQQLNSVDSANIRLPLNLIKTWDASRESEQDVLRVMEFLGGSDEKKLYKVSLHLNDSKQDNYW
ncbi:hypothetical protein KAR10_05415, partial [bacterium]|nr:hypothetical protein [bacterium]